MKSIWEGSISFALVNIPVKLYNIKKTNEFKFVLLDKEGHKLIYKRWCPIENKEIEWKDVVKGFKIDKDKYVILTKEDLEKLKIKSLKTIDIIGFISREDIDSIYIDKSYYVVPEEQGIKAYFLLQKVLALSGKYALGKVTIRGKERIIILRAYKNLILGQTLLYKDEINEPNFSVLVEEGKLSQKEIELASELVNKMSREIDIGELKDEYLENLKKLIEAKLKGEKFEVKEEQEEEEEDLDKALEESLKQK